MYPSRYSSSDHRLVQGRDRTWAAPDAVAEFEQSRKSVGRAFLFCTYMLLFIAFSHLP